MKTLVEKGNVDINAKSVKDGDTALMCAARRNKTKLAQMLIDNGADLNLQNEEGNTALLWAAVCGSTEVGIALINAKADLDKQDSNFSNTALGELEDSRAKVFPIC